MVRIILILLVVAALCWTFWLQSDWLQLAAGLAIFLFGMQCLEDGLRQLAGGGLERVLARSTSTDRRALLFGIGSTVLLQSSTLVSLLTIAFISANLIRLAGGIAIIFGANLGATSGIWLLALAGKGFSLSPLAMPLVVFGVLAGVAGPRGKGAGRVLLGIAFIFMGIDQIRAGFATFGDAFDPHAVSVGGLTGTLLAMLAGLVATVVLQSSHATLMLVLAALAGGQLTLDQSFAIAIGANVGSSVSTSAVGMLGSERNGQRLALAHVIFNITSAIGATALLAPMTTIVRTAASLTGFADNSLLQLALFHTLFNAGGVLAFWPWRRRLARWLTRWLPERGDPPAIPADKSEAHGKAGAQEPIRARYLGAQALESPDAAAAAIALELHRLGRLSLEVIAHTLFLPPDTVAAVADKSPAQAAPADRPPAPAPVDAEALYRQRVKGVHADLLTFLSRLDPAPDEEHGTFRTQAQLAARQIIDAVKCAQYLQKNLGAALSGEPSPWRDAYVELQQHLAGQLREAMAIAQSSHASGDARARLGALEEDGIAFTDAFRQRLFAMIRRHALDGMQAGSLMNDLENVERIHRSLAELLAALDEPASVRQLRELSGEVAITEPSPSGTPATRRRRSNGATVLVH